MICATCKLEIASHAYACDCDEPKPVEPEKRIFGFRAARWFELYDRAATGRVYPSLVIDLIANGRDPQDALAEVLLVLDKSAQQLEKMAVDLSARVSVPRIMVGEATVTAGATDADEAKR